MPRESYGPLSEYPLPLFTALSRLSAACFAYEQSCTDWPKNMEVANIHLYEQALAEIPDLNNLTVLPDSIALLYGKKEIAQYILQLRLLNWRKWYRGPVKQHGKITFAKFRSDLNSKEESILNLNLGELRKLCVTY